MKAMKLVEEHLDEILGKPERESEADYVTPQNRVNEVFEKAKADYAAWQAEQETNELIDEAADNMTDEEVQGLDERKPTLVQDLSKWKGKH